MGWSQFQRKQKRMTVSHLPKLPAFSHVCNNGIINYIDTSAKCRHLTKFTYKGTLRQLFIRLYRLEIRVHSVRGGGMGFCWRPYFAGVLHSVSADQIHNLQNCYITPNKNYRRGGGFRQINTCRKVPLQVSVLLHGVYIVN